MKSSKAAIGIFYLSIAMLVFWIIITLALANFPIEISGRTQEFFEKWRFYTVLSAIIFTLFGTLKKGEANRIAVVKFIFTCIGFMIALIFFVFTALAGMCVYTTDAILFQDKLDSKDQIVGRDFGCGATDSGPSHKHISQVYFITKDILWIKERDFDTAIIDSSKWRRIKE